MKKILSSLHALALLGFALSSITARGSTDYLPQFPDDLAYTQADLKIESEAALIEDIKEIDARLAAENLKPIDPTQNPLDHSHGPPVRVFSDYSLEHYAFVLVGVELSHPALVGKALVHPDGYLFHGKLARSGAIYALFGVDAGIPQFDRMIKRPSTATGRTSLWFASLVDRLSFISDAQAKDKSKFPAECSTGPESPAQKKAGALEAKQAAQAPRDTAAEWWRCPWGIAQGAWEATGGAVAGVAKVGWSLVKGTWRLITNPKRWWHDTTEKAKAMGDFFKNFSFKELFQGAKEEFKSLSAGERKQKICKIITEVTAAIALGHIALTGSISVAQKTILVYRSSATYRKIAGAALSMEAMAKTGAAAKKVTQAKPKQNKSPPAP